MRLRTVRKLFSLSPVPMTTRLSLLALALLLPLAACETEPDTDVADVTVEPADPMATDDMMDDDMADDPMMDDPAMDSDVTAQGTLDAVPAAGLTAMAPATAVSNIDSWIAQLDGATFTNASEIRDGLMTLRTQLQADPIDGNAVGETLTNLGNWTTEAAGGDAALSQLGSALTSAGQGLTSGSM